MILLRPITYEPLLQNGSARLISRVSSELQICIRPEVTGIVERPEHVVQQRVPELHILELNNVVCAPRQVLIHEGRILPDSFRRRGTAFPHYCLEPRGGAFTSKFAISPAEALAEPHLYLDGEQIGHFGHFTLEILSRLWAYQHLNIRKLPVLMSGEWKPYYDDLLSPFGIERNNVRLFNTPVLCNHLIIASQSYVLEQFASAQAFSVWEHIGKSYEIGSSPKLIYASRSHWKQQRRLENEEQIERLFHERGFIIVHTEEMPAREQVSLFRQADVIAGPCGSAFYNAAYCHPHRAAKRLILAPSTFVTGNDGLLARSQRGQVRYVTGTQTNSTEVPMLGSWVIDSDLVAREADSLLRNLTIHHQK